MNGRSRWIFFLVLVIGVAFGCATVLDAAPFSSGAQLVRGGCFTLAFLGSGRFSHEELREFQSLGNDIADECKLAGRMGVAVPTTVRIILFADTRFPARELWTVFGLAPDEAFFSQFERDLLAQRGCRSEMELRSFQGDLSRKYSLVRGYPKVLWMTNAGKIYRKDIEAQEVKEYLQRLRESLGKPLVEVDGFYDYPKQAAYSSIQRAVWVPTHAKKGLHRLQGTINHEVAHHFFEMILDRVLSENRLAKSYTPWGLDFLRSSGLTPENELFADYLALANGNQNQKKVHRLKGKPISDEQKRYFSKERTLDEFLAESRKKPTSHFFTEEHNILNPIRSLLWQLKIILGLPVTNAVMVDAARERLREYFVEDVRNYKHEDMSSAIPGVFVLKDYPRDILTVNKRFFGALSKAARKRLDPRQLAVFESVSKEVMGNHYPR